MSHASCSKYSAVRMLVPSSPAHRAFFPADHSFLSCKPRLPAHKSRLPLLEITPSSLGGHAFLFCTLHLAPSCPVSRSFPSFLLKVAPSRLVGGISFPSHRPRFRGLRMSPLPLALIVSSIPLVASAFSVSRSCLPSKLLFPYWSAALFSAGADPSSAAIRCSSRILYRHTIVGKCTDSVCVGVVFFTK